MSKISRSALGGLLFAVWAMCFVFPASLVLGFMDHTPIAAILVQQVFNFFFLWFVCGAIAYTVTGMFDEMNRRPPRDDKSDQDNPSDREYDDKDGPGGRGRR